MRADRWPPLVVTRLEGRFNELRELVRTASMETPDTRDWLARMLVVRSCGYLEQVVLEVQRAYIAEKSGGLVRSFAHSWLEKTNNPTSERLLLTTGRFDENLRVELADYLAEDDFYRQRELDFLVDRRNKIAHGLNEGVNPGKALTLSDLADDLAGWFILRMRPSTI